MFSMWGGVVIGGRDYRVCMPGTMGYCCGHRGIYRGRSQIARWSKSLGYLADGSSELKLTGGAGGGSGWFPLFDLEL